MPRLIVTDEEMIVLLHEMGVQDAPHEFFDDYGDKELYSYHRGFLMTKLQAFKRTFKKKDDDKRRIWDAIVGSSKG